MKKIDGCSSDRKNCVGCGKKTGRYKGYAYKDGIEVDIPVCDKCLEKMKWSLDMSMDIHLKGIAQSVRENIVMSYYEKRMLELEREKRLAMKEVGG